MLPYVLTDEFQSAMAKPSGRRYHAVGSMGLPGIEAQVVGRPAVQAFLGEAIQFVASSMTPRLGYHLSLRVVVVHILK